MAGIVQNEPGQVRLSEAHEAISSPTDALAHHYTAVASDDQNAECEREAAMLFSVAESKLEDHEGCEECERSAKEAFTLFQRAGNQGGCADAARLRIHALRSKADALKYNVGADDADSSTILKQAELFAEEELARFKGVGFKRGQAAMLLSWAEVNEHKRGSDERNEALERATAAKKLAKEVGDDKLQAHAALCLIKLLQREGDKGGAVSMADESVALYRRAGHKKGEAKALRLLGVTRIQAEQFEDGVQAAFSALALTRELGEVKEEACVNLAIAQHYLARNTPQMALSYVRDALNIFETSRSGDCGSWIAQTYGAMVECLVAGGSTKEALRLALQCSEFCSNIKDKRAEALGFATLSRAHIAVDDLQGALVAAEDALNSAQVLKDARFEAHMMRQVGQVHIVMRNYDEATKIGQESAGMMQGIQDKQEEALLLNTIGEAACEQYDYETVFQTTQEQRALFQQAGDRSREASCLLASASCIMDTRYEEALDMVQEAMDIFADIKEERGVARAFRNLAVMYKARGDYESALSAAQNMRDKMNLVDDKAAEATAVLLLAEIQTLRDNPTIAVKLANEAQALCKRSGDKMAEVNAWIVVSSAVCESLMQKGQAAMEKGRAKALKPAQEALSMAKKLNCKALIAHALYRVGAVHMLTGRISDAMQAANEARAIFHSKGDRINEVAVVMLMAEVQYSAGREERTIEVAEEVITMAESIGDSNSADRARKLIEKMRPSHPVGAPSAGWVFQAPAGPSDAAEAAPAAVSTTVAAKPEEKGLDEAMVSRVVFDVAKNIIGSDEEISQDVGLMDSGMDSLSALSFRQTLSQQVNIKLPSSFVFDYPTVREVTNRVMELSKE